MCWIGRSAVVLLITVAALGHLPSTCSADDEDDFDEPISLDVTGDADAAELMWSQVSVSTLAQDPPPANHHPSMNV
jgi:hypothetical protein